MMKTISYTFISKNFNPKIASFLYEAADNLSVKYLFMRPTQHRLGTFLANGNQTKIHVRQDLNKEHFLIILCHELAHAMVWREYKNNAKAHGQEWAYSFKIILKIIFSKYKFEDKKWEVEALEQIEKPQVTYQHKYDENELKENEIYLKSLPENEFFFWKNMIYQKIQKNRTRVLCIRTNDNKKYLFVENAIVLKLK